MSNEKYTRDQIWDRAWVYARNLSYEDLVEFYAEDLYEFYRQSADDQELEEFMNDNEEINHE